MENEENDITLVRHCLAGKSFAWEEFVDRFALLVLRVIEATAHHQQHTICDEDKSDLCEAVFRALRHNEFQLLREYEGGASVVTYLVVLTRRLTCAFLQQS